MPKVISAEDIATITKLTAPGKDLPLWLKVLYLKPDRSEAPAHFITVQAEKVVLVRGGSKGRIGAEVDPKVYPDETLPVFLGKVINDPHYAEVVWVVVSTLAGDRVCAVTEQAAEAKVPEPA